MIKGIIDKNSPNLFFKAREKMYFLGRDRDPIPWSVWDKKKTHLFFKVKKSKYCSQLFIS